MTAEERAQLLRESFKPKPIGRNSSRSEHWPKRVPYVVLPKPTGKGFVCCGPLRDVIPPAWVQMADAKAKPTVKTKRRCGTPVLAKIAAQLPKKLPRVSLPQ